MPGWRSIGGQLDPLPGGLEWPVLAGSRHDGNRPEPDIHGQSIAKFQACGWLALRWTGELSYVFVALSAGLVAFGLINAVAVARGAWFGPGRLDTTRT